MLCDGLLPVVGVGEVDFPRLVAGCVFKGSRPRPSGLLWIWQGHDVEVLPRGQHEGVVGRHSQVVSAPALSAPSGAVVTAEAILTDAYHTLPVPSSTSSRRASPSASRTRRLTFPANCARRRLSGSRSWWQRSSVLPLSACSPCFHSGSTAKGQGGLGRACLTSRSASLALWSAS